MSIEILPVGVTCNLRCEYCYEEAERKVTPTVKYHREKVLAAASKSHGFWQLFGGEPLLIGLTELEELLALGHKDFGMTGLQTNATLITPAHIDLFRKYNTQVGISLDGPDDLNDSRWAGTVEATRKATAKTHRAIDMVIALSNEPGAWWGHGPTLIVTLHSGNCSEDVFPRFKDWIREIDAKGVKFINFHYLEMDHKASKWYLDDTRMKEVMSELAALEKEMVQLDFLNFDEALDLLRGDSRKVTCVYHACDGWSTAAVQGIGNDGSPGNCTREVKDGIPWLPGEGFGTPAPWQIGEPFPSTRAHLRQLSLYVTPQEHGGCKDCRFFVMCTGHCPGTGHVFDEQKEGDWRLRSTHCEVLKDQFAEMEQKLLGVGETPLSLDPDLEKVEQLMYNTWANQGQIYLTEAVEQVRRGGSSIRLERESNGHGDAHGDHTDMSREKTPTQNVPHGDAHGDHTDMGREKTPSQYIPHGDHTNAVTLNIPHGDHTDTSSR